MARGVLRCTKCRSDYQPFGSRAAINRLWIDHARWIMLIKMFELGISARQAALQTGVSYPTTLEAFDIIRWSIVERMARTDKKLRGELEADEAYFGGRRKGNRGRRVKDKKIMFGILERGAGKVRVNVVGNAGARALTSKTLRIVRKGSTIYTDKWTGYDTLVTR